MTHTLQKLLIGFLLLSCYIYPKPTLAAPENPRLPSDGTYLGSFFNLLKYIPPEYLEIYESRDMARKDMFQWITNDPRPAQNSICDPNDPNPCSAPPGEMVTVVSEDGTVSHPTGDGVCRGAGGEKDEDGKRIEGAAIYRCDYRKKPRVSIEVSSVDYSETENLIFEKIQQSYMRYDNQGNISNPLTFGSHNLTLDLRELYAFKAIALAQAAETENTFSDTGEWPLGGVLFDAAIDSKDPNSPSYLEVWQKLNRADPNSPAGQVKTAAEVLRDLYWPSVILPTETSSPDTTSAVSTEISDAKETIYQIMTKSQSTTANDDWVSDFLRTPICGVGYDKGYELISMCFLGICNPRGNARTEIVIAHLNGERTTYADTRSRQNLCAAVIKLRRSFTRSQSDDILRKLAKQNPLYRYSLLSSTYSTPTIINKRLEGSGVSTLSDLKNFSILWFHKVLDGWKENGTNNFWYVKFGYTILGQKQPEVADAFEDSPKLGVIANLISQALVKISGFERGLDYAFQVLHHKITIPPVTAQSLDYLESFLDNKEINLSTQESISALSEAYTNSVKTSDGNLSAGNKYAAILGKTSFSRLMTCNMTGYSRFDTPIESYIRKQVQGCFSDGTLAGDLGYLCKGATSLSTNPLYKICNTNRSGDYLANVGYPQLPKEMIEIIESAAQKHKVPAAVILGVLFGEGGFERESIYGKWTSEMVLAGSSCRQEMKGCRSGNISNTGALGPYQIIPAYFDETKGSPCNFYDATEHIATELGKGRFGFGSVWNDTYCLIGAGGPQITYNQGSITTGEIWSTQDVVTAARAHRGLCDPNFTKHVVDFYGTYSCK